MSLRKLGKSILTFVLVVGAVVSTVVDSNTTQAWLWKGLRFTGGVMAASGLGFLLQTLGAID